MDRLLPNARVDRVRLHFQETPWDIYLVLGYTIVLTGVLFALRTGNLFAILLILFVPGYVLVAALFPSNKEIDWIERIALSIGLSIAIVPLLGLLLNFTILGIRFEPIVAFIAAFSGGVGLLAYWRRLGLAPADRLSATVVVSMGSWKEESRLDKALTVALVASIVIAAGVTAYVVVTPRPGEAFTEFFILDRNGTTSDYPTRLNVSETGTVVMGVVNHEFASVDYTVRVDLVGIEIRFNQTSGFNETLEMNRTDWDWFNFTITNEGNWSRSYNFSIPWNGTWKVQFLLFRDNDLVTAYRNLHLFVTVTPPGLAPPRFVAIGEVR